MRAELQAEVEGRDQQIKLLQTALQVGAGAGASRAATVVGIPDFFRNSVFLKLGKSAPIWVKDRNNNKKGENT